MPKMNDFNIRVYGIFIENNKVLLSDEYEFGMHFTKFPGGGLEQGEGTIDCLKREFLEEHNAEIEVLEHFYTTDFYVKSIFGDQQLISIYYLVDLLKPMHLNIRDYKHDFKEMQEKQVLRYKNIHDELEQDLTFPIDKHVASLLCTKFK